MSPLLLSDITVPKNRSRPLFPTSFLGNGCRKDVPIDDDADDASCPNCYWLPARDAVAQFQIEQSKVKSQHNLASIRSQKRRSPIVK